MLCGHISSSFSEHVLFVQIVITLMSVHSIMSIEGVNKDLQFVGPLFVIFAPGLCVVLALCFLSSFEIISLNLIV